ncbi:DUF397 domain-containing protein [Streptomyces spongiae]|uniref:DUF397 domain-containing protein n=1 Tax=Streptomyces spongiae TaxID=565072 RepID=A0A5N8XSK7_9ACTN|nr:DUF397 domain-containing protein [Streptomyces spongiae]MPY62377.1 DUF397 domain-containing protein [Streptomyces spongiae]
MTSTLQWFKSSYSNSSGGECLEVAHEAELRATHIRDSKNPTGPTLAVSGEAWVAFLATVSLTL